MVVGKMRAPVAGILMRPQTTWWCDRPAAPAATPMAMSHYCLLLYKDLHPVAAWR